MTPSLNFLKYVQLTAPWVQAFQELLSRDRARVGIKELSTQLVALRDRYKELAPLPKKGNSKLIKERAIVQQTMQVLVPALRYLRAIVANPAAPVANPVTRSLAELLLSKTVGSFPRAASSEKVRYRASRIGFLDGLGNDSVTPVHREVAEALARQLVGLPNPLGINTSVEQWYAQLDREARHKASLAAKAEAELLNGIYWKILQRDVAAVPPGWSLTRDVQPNTFVLAHAGKQELLRVDDTAAGRLWGEFLNTLGTADPVLTAEERALIKSKLG